MAIKHADTKVSGAKGYASEWNKDHIIDGDVDFDQNQPLSMAIENRTTWPAGPVEGQIIHRTDYHTSFIWNGTVWTSLSPIATIVVAADGTGHTTDIQTGINMLPAGGGAVYIKEGTYNISTSIDINKNNTIIVGAGKSTVINATADIDLITVSSQDGVIIQQVYFKGFHTNTESGIELTSVTDMTIFDCYFYDCSTGIYSNNSNVNIYMCYFDTCECGIWFEATSGKIIVNGNHFTNSSVYGILAYSAGAGVNLTNAIISNNIIDGAGDGIFFYSAENCIITSNSVASCVRFGIGLVTNCDNNIISNNNVTDCLIGIDLFAASDDKNIVVGNHLLDNTTPIDNDGTGTEAAHNIIA